MSQQRAGVWVPDNNDGTYSNPVIYADYSDPDVIRVGNDYYMVASSFSHFPGLPILHSVDLVNWKIIGYAAHTYPDSAFFAPQHGKGIWAPSIRYHNGEYYIYFGDPDRGIYVTKAVNPAGPWTPLKLIRKVTGWIDPCPLWDDDGNAYLVHAFANSRVGIKSILAMNKMSPDGMEIYDDGVVVFVGHWTQPTMEGPKLYKRNGYYYIFAPAGGVKTGWQTVLRSKNIWGPYEEKIVLEQGSTKINGPHQGAWVETPTGEHWFLHFQDRYAYGRILHLQPMTWKDNWPLMGVDYDGNGIGEPVAKYRKPATPVRTTITVPQTSDSFDSLQLGLQWQWQAIPQTAWYSLEQRKGWLRLFAQNIDTAEKNLWNVPSLLLQKFPAERFSFTTKVDVKNLKPSERAGIVVFGMDYATLAVEKTESSMSIVLRTCTSANKNGEERQQFSVQCPQPVVYLRVDVAPTNPAEVIPTVSCVFSFSNDGKNYKTIAQKFVAKEGIWVGAKVGVFAVSATHAQQNGFADFDMVEIR
nr:GH43 [uncultured bacterium]